MRTSASRCSTLLLLTTLVAACIGGVAPVDAIHVAAVQLVPASGASAILASLYSALQVTDLLAHIAAGTLPTGGVAVGNASGVRPDLVVFPEYTLLGNFSTGTCGAPDKDLDMNHGCAEVPAAGADVDCSQGSRDPIATIVCDIEARQYENITFSVNMCERCVGDSGPGGKCAVTKAQSPAPAWKPSNVSFFNTQVVVRGRKVLATYRKFHPWATDCYDTPELQVRTFNLTTTGAGPSSSASETFGLFTCFDIVFPQPADSLFAEGVRFVSYSSAIPLIAHDAVAIYSKTHNVTMVNANLQPGQTSVVQRGETQAKCGSYAALCVAFGDV